MWPMMLRMRRLINSVVTKMRYEDPIKSNSILINESVYGQKKKKLLDHVLFLLLYKLFSFISIGEVFNFRHKVYFFPTYYFKY